MATNPLPAASASSRTSPAGVLPRPAVMGRDALYLMAGLPAGVIAFSVLVTGVSLAAGLAVTLLGIPVFFATLVGARAMGDAERWRAGWVLVRRCRAPTVRGRAASGRARRPRRPTPARGAT